MKNNVVEFVNLRMTIINSYLRESMGYKYVKKFATIYTFLAKYVLFGEKTILNEF